MSESKASFVISSAEERKRLFEKIKNISDSMTRIEMEKDTIKEATKEIVEEFQLPNKLVGKLIKTFHKDNFNEVVASEEQFQSLYVQVVGEQ